MENVNAPVPLFQKLGISESLYLKAEKVSKTEEAAVNKYAARLVNGKRTPLKLKKKDGVFNLAVVLCAMRETEKRYAALGIPEKIFSDTFRDVGYWCDNALEQYSEEGLKNVKWIKKHLSLRVFRLGRLQFEFSRFVFLPNAGIGNILKCPFRGMEKCIAVHVPQGEKLDFDECLKSFDEADAFFEKYFPRYRYRVYDIVSWLLNPDLKSVLNENSNILRFASLFTLYGRVPDSDMNERRIFGYAKARDEYVPRNALQRYTLERINAGKPLYSYNGYRKK